MKSVKLVLLGIFLTLFGSFSAFADCSLFAKQFTDKAGAVVNTSLYNYGRSWPIVTKIMITKDKNVRSRFVVSELYNLTKYNQKECANRIVVADTEKYCKAYNPSSVIDSYQLLTLDNKCFLVSDAINGSLTPIFEITETEMNGEFVTRMLLQKINSEYIYDWQLEDTISVAN